VQKNDKNERALYQLKLEDITTGWSVPSTPFSSFT